MTLKPIITENINKASTLMPDEALVYERIGEAIVAHGTVNHSANEYVRAEWLHTNNAENYFSILKPKPASNRMGCDRNIPPVA